MAAPCCLAPPPSGGPALRRVLWISLLLSAGLFVVEIAGEVQSGSGSGSGSGSLLADAIDLLGDAAKDGLPLAVLSMALAARAKASPLKAALMARFGGFRARS